MEVQAHDPALTYEGVLRGGGVLEGEAVDDAALLLQEVVAAVANGKQILGS